MFGNNKYMKWLFWGGLIGTSASIIWRMVDKRRLSIRREKKYRYVRNLASKTMNGLRENLGDIMGRDYQNTNKKMQQNAENLKSKSKHLDKKLISSSRWLKKNRTKWD